MTDFENPMQLDGFAFLEFSGPKADKLRTDFLNLGFKKVGQHKTHQVELYRQGDTFFLLHLESNTQAFKHAQTHGAGASAMGFKVKDAEHAFQRALELGAESYDAQGIYDLKAIKGIGGTGIYFVEDDSFFEQTFDISDNVHEGVGLGIIDHLTHNVHRGNMDTWAEFYQRLFNFREIRFFDIKGLQTGLISRAMSSPCNKIKIPLNESTDDNSQIEEFLKEFNGEGIQHIALTTERIADTVEAIRSNGIDFLDVPDTYYEMVGERIPWHEEDLPRLQENKILIDGEQDPAEGLLLQIFTQNMLGPVFFEIIQRKGNEGFGEGNFKALFESIERDQIKRGVLKAEGSQ